MTAPIFKLWLTVSMATAFTLAANIKPTVPGVAGRIEANEPKTNLSLVHFYLHTNENPIEPHELFVGDEEALESSHYHAGGPLWILVHGFGVNTSGTFPNETGLVLLTTNPLANVILLDWFLLQEIPDYAGAVEDAYAISNYTAELLEFLVHQEVVRPADIHLVGFSLGGQIVGITGNRYEQLTGEKLGRVTGLDPAGPLFTEEVHPDDKISPEDAIFVDVIHANGGYYGNAGQSGQIDFYPNGGTLQAGCGVDIWCSHLRAGEYFKESITATVPFRACNCLNWDEYESGFCACTETAEMGLHVEQTEYGQNGTFYLATNTGAPFAQG